MCSSAGSFKKTLLILLAGEVIYICSDMLRINVRNLRVPKLLVPSLVVRRLTREAYHPQRIAMLQKIYAPLSQFEQNSREYGELLSSGRLWRDYFQPWDPLPSDDIYQQEHSQFLKEIDRLKSLIPSIANLTKNHLLASLAQQSVAIEGNSLNLDDSRIISDALEREGVFAEVKKSSKMITKMPLPEVLFPSKLPEEVIELRNQLVANYYAINHLVTAQSEIGENEIKDLQYMIVRDTKGENIMYWDGYQQRAGEYRIVPVYARGMPKVIYPYHVEIPSLVSNLFAWRDNIVREGKLHPILIACKLLATFLHVHPFHDGNGRVGRTVFAVYLIRNGFPPAIFQTWSHESYIQAIAKAQQERDYSLLYGMVLEAIRNILLTFLQK